MTIIICTAWISIHALLAESDAVFVLQITFSIYFYPRSPCGERHCYIIFLQSVTNAFLSTLSLRRATLIFTTRHPAVRVFLSTLSLRRATLQICTKFYPIGISIHALLAESDLDSSSSSTPAGISIHALLAESDQCGPLMYTAPSISIHALLAESDGVPCMIASNIFLFLSTLSLRRATPECKTQHNGE